MPDDTPGNALHVMLPTLTPPDAAGAGPNLVAEGPAQ